MNTLPLLNEIWIILFQGNLWADHFFPDPPNAYLC